MSLLITSLIIGEVNTISIPTDAIFIVSLLIVFTVLGYFFNNIFSNETNQLAPTTDVDSNLQLVKKTLENQLKLEATTVNQTNEERPIIKKLNFLPPSTLVRVRNFAFLTMGVASLLGLQHIQKLYEDVSTSHAKVKLINQISKSPLLLSNVKALDKNQNNIKQISYIDPRFSNTKSSKENHDYPLQEKQKKNNFSF